MGKEKPFRLEAAGWGFWLVTTLLLAGPFIYGAFQLTDEHLSREVPVGIGLVGATITSAFFTVAVNAVIQQAHARRKAVERKQTKHAKKKK